jgi:hypothetical protein
MAARPISRPSSRAYSRQSVRNKHVPVVTKPARPVVHPEIHQPPTPAVPAAHQEIYYKPVHSSKPPPAPETKSPNKAPNYHIRSLNASPVPIPVSRKSDNTLSI